ncbi:MAG: DUF2793 domain-containing protein [Alphaproteobacteria bacterium]|nr:DUF2793 domain-containing protein [Alphaproteobacteria bacterium]MDE2629591.1 DUF2793 domain-containing protein [Alphaproteobacteria bacterium]
MSDNTPRLALPELAADDAQNHLVHNEALIQLDAFVDLYLLGQFVNAPPSSPADGDAYLVGGSPTGAWSGYAYKIAYCIDGAWRFYTPFNGLRAYEATTGAFIVYAGGTWTDWNSLISSNEVSVASAATCDLGAAGSLFVQITGTTAITSFGAAANKLRFVRFAGALTLTHNAASLILLGGASRTTAAGDVGIYASDGSGNWRERGYSLAANNPSDVLTATNTKTLTNKTLGATTLPGSGSIDSSGNVGIGVAAGGGPKLAVNGAIQGGSVSATNGTILLQAKYDGNPAQTVFTGYATGAVGLGQYMYQNGSSTWLSSYAYGSIGRSALIVGSTGLFFWVAPEQNVAVGSALTTQPTIKFQVDANGTLLPGTDNSQNVGSASLRWGTVYAGTGTINTSGAATKTNVRALSDAEIAVAKTLAGNVRIFQFCDAVAAKGADAARLHAGMIYEDVMAAFAAQGLDPERYGIVCRDAAMKTVTKTRSVQVEGADVEETYEVSEPDLDAAGAPKWVLGLRYSELAQFVTAGLAARLAALEAKKP